MLAVNGVMHIPPELRTRTVIRRRAYGMNMLVLMIVMLAVVPMSVAMVMAARSVVLLHGLRLGLASQTRPR